MSCVTQDDIYTFGNKNNDNQLIETWSTSLKPPQTYYRYYVLVPVKIYPGGDGIIEVRRVSKVTLSPDTTLLNLLWQFLKGPWRGPKLGKDSYDDNYHNCVILLTKLIRPLSHGFRLPHQQIQRHMTLWWCFVGASSADDYRGLFGVISREVQLGKMTEFRWCIHINAEFAWIRHKLGYFFALTDKLHQAEFGVLVLRFPDIEQKILVWGWSLWGTRLEMVYKLVHVATRIEQFTDGQVRGSQLDTIHTHSHTTMHTCVCN
jgi:hypothetical protein